MTMPAGRLLRTISGNAMRSWRRFVLSTFGIVVGIAAFVFFLGLSAGVGDVLFDIFPLDQVEVVAPQAGNLSKRIDDGVVAELRSHPDVREAVPRMSLAFPAVGVGYFGKTKTRERTAVPFDVGGFVDGIMPEDMAGEDRSELFKDWETPALKGQLKDCRATRKCDDGMYYCDVDWRAGDYDPAVRKRARNAPDGEPSEEATPTYRGDYKCHHKVPVYVSPAMLELYNKSYAPTHGLPPLPQDLAKWTASAEGMSRMSFYVTFGQAAGGVGSSKRISSERWKPAQAMVIGISARVRGRRVGIPQPYVRRWNAEYVDDDAASRYASVLVTLKDKDEVAPFIGWLQEEGRDLRVEDNIGEKFATAIFFVTLLLFVISVVILTISAVNIAHTLFMQMSERQKEIGVMRAVGATRFDIGLIILGESLFIGIVGGLAGVALAFGLAELSDFVVSRQPEFPFKPDSLFDFEGWVLGAAMGLSALFCVIGGALPAWHAARMPPARALAQQ